MFKSMKEQAYGIIPLKQHPWQVLMIQHQAGHWGLPKGRPEPGLNPYENAKRELFEETGLLITQPLDASVKENYSFQRDQMSIDKTVIYFLALVEGSLKLQEIEVKQAKWLNIEKAIEIATFDEMKKVLQNVKVILESQML